MRRSKGRQREGGPADNRPCSEGGKGMNSKTNQKITEQGTTADVRPIKGEGNVAMDENWKLKQNGKLRNASGGHKSNIKGKPRMENRETKKGGSNLCKERELLDQARVQAEA